MITLQNVSKIYKTGEVETHALKNLDLKILKGELIVVLGPSGSGKSTLLNVVSGLDTPTNGSIRVGDLEISKMKSEQLTKFRREQLGFVFQSYNLFQTLTVYENVALAAKISDDPWDIDEVLTRVGIYEQRNKFPSQLSGGEQQRVSIARAVVKKPRILFCDEPTGALDESSSKDVLHVLEELNREFETTLVMITHNPNIGNMGDRIVKMNSGEIVEIETVKEKVSAYDINWS